MSKSKSHKGNALIVSLALTIGITGVAVQSLVCAPAGVAAPANWYDNEKSFFDRGKRDYNNGEIDQSLKDFSDCIRCNPNRAEAYYWRSMCYSALHQNDQAISDLDQAVRLEPRNPAVFLNRGLIYSNQGKHESAISDFDEALKLDPSMSEARTNRDFCAKELAKTKVAEQKTKEQTDQAAVAASGGSVLSIAGGGTAGGAGSTSSSGATVSLSGRGSGYTPYVGKGDPKLIALQKMQKEQREMDAKLYKEKAAEDRLAMERAKVEARNTQLAIQEKEREIALENAKIKLQEQEAKRLAMAHTPMVQPAVENLPPQKQHPAKGPAKGASQNVELSAAGKKEAAEDALEIVNRPVRDKWALIIGISNFADKKLNLHYPAKDAQDFYDFLTKEGNFAKDHVKLLINEQATRTNILSDLGDKWLPHVASPDDLVLIYISSHGSPSEMDNENVNYLLAYDSDPDTLFASGLPMQSLTNVIKTRVHSDRVVLVLDACHSGGAEPGGKGITRKGNLDPDAIAQGTGQLVISSSLSNEVSWESKSYQNSVFTRCLIDALRKNGNATTLGDAFETMTHQVQDQVLHDRGVLQTPVLRSRWKGEDLRISTPPAAPRPGI